MKTELDEKLCQTYPNLYRDRHGDKTQTSMCWGFSCHDGWYPLIDTISKLLSEHSPESRAVQVKEKFGGLRFYYSGGDDYCRGVVMMAEDLSSNSCEICGAPGATYTANHWMSTRCNEHAEPRHVGGTVASQPIAAIHGLGLGWSRLVISLKSLLEWHVEKNGMPPARFNVERIDGQLCVRINGGNDKTRGMMDFINQYAKRIDEKTGAPIEPVCEW